VRRIQTAGIESRSGDGTKVSNTLREREAQAVTGGLTHAAVSGCSARRACDQWRRSTRLPGEVCKALAQREKLLYFLTLRQMETSSEVLRSAYERLGEAISAASGWNLSTVILDWLDAELRHLPPSGEGSTSGSQLMKAAVAMSHVLKQ
jgi:hypothetical protein